MSEKLSVFLVIIGGLVVGSLNGLFGGGGGMVAVPVLSKFMKLDTRRSHATAILVILPISVISAVIYIMNNNIEWRTLLPVGGGVIAGGIIGALLLNKLNSKWIRFIFDVLMSVAGVFVLINAIKS